ncbi:hypothetical protein DH2020_013281 [Rehmannia glutinosa]|uniref:Uncharacterized protein n=1 Tax=Rehmannia glutinosa TaxID=99300 RepID=A0ABR0X500_REHGL
MPTPTKILERTVSTRRPPHASEDGATVEEDGSGETADESKTRKHISVAMRVTNYLIRTGYIWPVLILGLAIVIISSLVIHSRDLVCISASSSDHISRLFWGFDGLESDFGSLGVPWCRSKDGKTVEWTSKDLLQDLMIESGAFKGHSTWVLRQAMPNTPILSLSPRHPEKYLKKGPAYVDGNCTYFAGKDFVDFGSMDWRRVMRKHGIEDHSRVLVFFDDHQNELKRLKQALKAGFRHLVFEDNYDTGTGDHYSFRQICDQFYIRGGGHSCFKDSDEARVRFKRKKFWEKAVDIEELCGPGEAWWGVRGHMRDNFNHSNNAITFAEHFQNSRFVESVLDVYWELPPVAGPSLTHQTRYDPARAPSPIVEDGRYGLFQRLGLSRLESSVFNGYTQMVYLQVSEQGT